MWGRLTLLRLLAARFFRWWGGELAGLIPRQLHARLKPRSRLPAVEVDPEGAVIAVIWPGRKTAEPVAGLPPGTRCRLLLPAAAVVGKTLVLPEAAAATLAAVLRFQIEQETPFRAGDVYADHAVVRRDAKAKRIVVDWHLAPRALVDRAVGRVEALGLKVQSVGIAGEVENGRRFDFLRAGHEAGAAGTSGAGWRLRPALVGLLAVLLVALIAAPVLRKQEAAATLEARLAEAAGAATAVRRLGEELEQRRATASFVVERRLERPTASGLLRELTLLLPDDTWLHRLSVDGDEVSIAGLSPSSTALVARIDAHPWFHEVIYRAPTLQRRDSKLEAFDLTLHLSAEAAAQ